MTRLAYLRGDGVEMALAEEHLPGMKTYAMSSGLRRLAPVHAGSSLNRDAEGVAVLQCIRCGKPGTPDQMLANIDGKPFVDYEHERCPK